MKLRNGFVSNSSSSSFIVDTKDLTCEQATKILNHIMYSREMNTLEDYVNERDAWHISFDHDTMTGYTSMDNFSMYDFFKKIGVDATKVKWDSNG